ncbi:MAG: hypothetical protein RI891_1568, partial [Gemmatimonadota bacterium]
MAHRSGVTHAPGSTDRRTFVVQLTAAVGGVLGAPAILRSAPDAPDLILRGGVL